MRKALNLLWTLTRVKGPVEEADVAELITTMDPSRTKSLLGTVMRAKKSDRGLSLRLFREVDKELDAMSKRGLTGVDILNSFYDLVAYDESMPLGLQQAILSGIGDALYWASVAQDDILAVKAFLRKVVL